MKNYVPFTADFSALKAEILSSFEDDINSDTLVLHPPKAVFIAKSESLFLSPADFPPLEDFPTITSSVEGTGIEVYSLLRRIISNNNASIYTSLTYDTILIPLLNCEQCTLSLYSVNSDAVLSNSKFPPGIAPTHGNYKLSDCSLIETIELTTPIFIKANTVAWAMSTPGEGNNAHALTITSITGNNDHYFL
jgi:hypothetical protein